MLPDRDNDISTEYEFVESSTKTYAIQLGGERIIGKTDERAMEQAIYRNRSTERYQYLIYIVGTMELS